MKRIPAVTLLLMSLAAAAIADGGGLPPVKSTKPTKPAVVLLADGPGCIPTSPKGCSSTMSSTSNPTKPHNTAFVLLADGPGCIPTDPTKRCSLTKPL